MTIIEKFESMTTCKDCTRVKAKEFSDKFTSHACRLQPMGLTAPKDHRCESGRWFFRVWYDPDISVIRSLNQDQYIEQSLDHPSRVWFKAEVIPREEWPEATIG